MTSTGFDKGSACQIIPQPEFYEVATAGQTVFTLPATPHNGVVEFHINGQRRPNCWSVAGAVVTYDPALNDGYVLLGGEEITIDYSIEDCTGGPAVGHVAASITPTRPILSVTPSGQDNQTFAIDIKDDPTTPVEDVAALTDADRGASLGQVSFPNNRALTNAEVAQTNADKVSPDLQSLRYITTNRAAEGGAAGMRNYDGSLGGFSRAFGNYPDGSTIDVTLTNNGTTRIAGSDGHTVTLPSPVYTGQLLTIRGPFNSECPAPGEMLVSCAGGIAGVARRTDGMKRDVDTTEPEYSTITLRANELITLWGTPPVWRVVTHNCQFEAGIDYQESEGGEFSEWGEEAVGAGATVAVVLPYALTNADYTVSTSLEVSNKTNTSFDLENTTGSPVVAGWTLRGGRIV